MAAIRNHIPTVRISSCDKSNIKVKKTVNNTNRPPTRDSSLEEICRSTLQLIRDIFSETIVNSKLVSSLKDIANIYEGTLLLKTIVLKVCEENAQYERKLDAVVTESVNSENVLREKVHLDQKYLSNLFQFYV
jgi:hypothetical protein